MTQTDMSTSEMITEVDRTLPGGVELLFQQLLRNYFPIILLMLCVMYFLLTLGHFFALTGQARSVMMGMSILSGILFLCAYQLIKGDKISLKWMSALASGLILIVVSNSLTHLALTSQDIQSTNIALIIVASGCFLFSYGWWFILNALTLVSWFLVMGSFAADPNWIHFVFMQLLAVILSYATLRSRRSSAVQQAFLTEKAVEQAQIARAAKKEVTKLERLLPLCAWCKKIKSDDGSWDSVENYISRKTQAEITHGMCPECEADFAKAR